MKKKEFKCFFLQANISTEKIPILEWEYSFFKARNNSNYSQFCVFSSDNIISDNNKNYLNKYLGEIWDDIPTTFDQIIDSVIKRIGEVRVSNEGKFVDGLLDTSLETTKIINAVNASLDGTSTFPQKYLYSTLLGAELWRQLTVSYNSRIRKTYDKFPFQNSADTELNKYKEQFLKNLKDLNKSISTNTSLNYVILGCGTGKREAEFVKWLDQHYKVKNSSVILIDIASELINMSIESFHNAGIHNLQYAIMDIEVETSTKLNWIKEFYLSQEATNIFMFLGNTLANLDGYSFLNNLKNSMDENDILLTEFLSKKVEYQKINGINTTRIIRPSTLRNKTYNGEKFDFITNVLKVVGEPIYKNSLYLNSSIDGDEQNGFRIDQKFTYKTKTNKRIDLLGISIYDDVSSENLFKSVFESGNYKSMTIEYDIASDSNDSKIRMKYFLSKKN